MEHIVNHIDSLQGFDLKEVERFLRKARLVPETGCWVWVYYRDAGGYGKFTRATGESGGRPVPAHRLSHEMFVGPIPAGFQVHHKCENRACVNPEHLVALGTADHVAETSGHPKNQTHCWRGHEFTPENTRIYKATRNCRACVRLRMRERYGLPPLDGASTNLYCINNHPLFGENAHIIEVRGGYRRYCKQCRREAVDRHQAENQEAVLLAKLIRRADSIAGRKLQARQQLISLRQTAHLLPATTLVTLVQGLLRAIE